MVESVDRLSYLDQCPRLRAEFCQQCRGILADSEYGRGLVERKLEGHLCRCSGGQMVEVVQLSLIDLAAAINAEHEQCERAFKSSLEHARKAGELLIQAKLQVKHGEWLKWIEQNCRFKPRAAQNYVRIASRWNELSNAHNSAYLSIDQALTILARPTDEEPDDHPLQPMTEAVEMQAEPLIEYRPASDPDTIEQGLREGWIQPVSRATEPILNFRDEPEPPTSSTVEVRESDPKNERIENDYYPTPEWCIKALLKTIDIQGQVFEPCAGHGAIADHFYGAITNEPYPCKGSEPDYSEDATNPDLWALIEAEGGIDWVVTNPPYLGDLPVDILKLAYKTARVGVAFLLRLSMLEPCENRSEWLKEHAQDLTDVIVLNPRPRFRADVKGGDQVTVAWMVWRKPPASCINTRMIFVKRDDVDGTVKPD